MSVNKIFQNGDSSMPIVCGHRGAPAVTPENTIESFRSAQDRGATWVEFDVRPTADGSLVIHHDPDTSEDVNIATSQRRDLPKLIPNFGELPEAFPDLGLDIEMKTDDIGMSLETYADLVISEIDEHCATTSLMVTSFDPDALAIVRARRPDITTGLLVWDRPVSWAIDTAAEAGHELVAPWIKQLTQGDVDNARARGLGVITWTVNTDEQVRRSIDFGVDMIIGDDPATIIENL